jgi:hypothetical protein
MGVEQLHADPNAVAGTSYASANEELGVELGRRVPVGHLSAPIRERGSTRDDQQRAEVRERGDDVFHHSVDEIVVVGARKILERENGDRR